MDTKKLNEILDKLLGMRAENEWFEFKSATNSFSLDDLGKYFSALSNEANLKNEDFGWLVFGVSDQREIIGTSYRTQRDELDRLKHDIANQTSNRIKFVEIHELFRNEKRILMFQIPPATPGIPVTWKGHYYGRDGESLVPLNMQEQDQIRHQTPDWSSEVISGASVSDLDTEALSRARWQFSQKNPHLANEIASWDDILFLNKAKIMIKGQITRAAVVLLGKEESTHYISPSIAQISWILRGEDEEEKDYKHFLPPFLLNVDKVLASIRNPRHKYLPDGTLFPIEIDQYDPWVIREALHNCIAHQDYRLGGKINVIEKQFGEIVLSNRGSFIPGSVENMIHTGSPPETYRNPFLAHAMVNLNMIDTIGSGIRRMFTKQRERYFPLPDYTLESDRVTVVIIGRIIDHNYTRLLIKNTDLPLTDVIALDKVQKGIKISAEQRRHLRRKGLIEGRHPNVYIARGVSGAVGSKPEYTKFKAFDNKYYEDIIVQFIGQHKEATREDVERLLWNKLSDRLNDQQRKVKISNLLRKLAVNKVIENIGTKRYPKWVIVETQSLSSD